ncbi:MAG: hypothetical protein WC837_05055 [Bellilinea sp.]
MSALMLPNKYFGRQAAQHRLFELPLGYVGYLIPAKLVHKPTILGQGHFPTGLSFPEARFSEFAEIYALAATN